MSEITRILVPTDFSEPADAALTYALDLAAKVGASISLIHVFDDPFIGGMYTAEYVPMPPQMRADIVAGLRKQLADVVEKRGNPNLSAEVLVGPTAKAIVDAANDRHADLIVMGTHGRHGVAHLLLGSVAERVVRTAGCPVLTVRPQEVAAAA
jgi:nucleotide-binding universal stress UspA family protein